MAARTKRTSKPAVDIVDDIDELDEVETDEVEEAPAKPVRKRAAKKAPAPVEEDEDLEDELEDDEDEAPAPAKKKAPAKAKAADDTLGTPWLTDHINETLGTDHKPAAIRIALRKLAKDGKLDRTVGETRGRYSFTGPKDPVVKAVVAAVKSGAIDADRKEKLDALKSKASTKKASKAKAVEVEDDVEELDDDE